VRNNNESNSIETLTEEQEEEAKRLHRKAKQRIIEQVQDDVEKTLESEIDDGAPYEWKKLMKSSCQAEYYENLPKTAQTEITKWREKRMFLLEEKCNKELALKLNEAGLERNSKRFGRALVKSNCAKGRSSSEAMLSIWSENEEQYSMLKEGNALRVQNVLVRQSLHEGRLQLTVNKWTPMEVLGTLLKSPHLSKSMGFEKRKFLSAIRMNLLSRKIGKAGPRSVECRKDFLGVVLHWGQNEYKVSIYLTDESGMLCRVERDAMQVDRDPLQSQWHKLEKCSILSFRDLKVLPFDEIEGCGVAQWTQSSSFTKKSPRFEEVQRWMKSTSGKNKICAVADYLEAGYSRSFSALTKVGYIVKFSRDCALSNASPLTVWVDSANDKNLLPFKFPILLLDSLAAIISTDLIELEPEELSKMVQDLGILFHFSLRNFDGRLEVVKLSPANIRALLKLQSHMASGV